ncbi:MAG: hypothetical protein U5K69_07110 [Balneolaceae bacterium]|nr:hypothetical protein [Balneolaceae bacterium]
MYYKKHYVTSLILVLFFSISAFAQETPSEGDYFDIADVRTPEDILLEVGDQISFQMVTSG